MTSKPVKAEDTLHTVVFFFTLFLLHFSACNLIIRFCAIEKRSNSYLSDLNLLFVKFMLTIC
jgi:hypothetical protein